MKGKHSRRLAKTLSAALATIMLMSSSILPSASAVWLYEEEVPESVWDLPYWDTSLSYEERAADLLSRMNLREKSEFLHSRPAVAGQINAIPRLGVGSYIWPTAGLHGVANMQGMLQNFGKVWSENGEPWQDGTATAFPSTIGQGTTWNPELIAQMGQEIGYELRVYYNTSTKGLTAGGPGFNLSRDPRWGRADESFGEDPFLQGLMGTYFVDGYQGVYDDEESVTAVPVVKHFASNNSENGRYYTSANMTEAEVREYYYKPFEMVVKDADPQGIMIGYNAINGVPNHGNYEMLTETLKETWGFTGYVSSDNGGVANLNGYYGNNTGRNSNLATGRHETNPDLYPVLEDVTTEQEAAALFVKAGGAHDLGGGDKPVAKWAVYCVEHGLLTEDELDKAVMQELLVRFRTGEFDLDNHEYEDMTLVRELMSQASVQNLNLEMAEQSIVVLENNNAVLPLAKDDGTGNLVCDYENVVVVGKYLDEMQVTGYTCGHPDWKNEEIRVTYQDGIEAAYNEVKPEGGTITFITPEGETGGDWTIPSGDWNAIEAADLVIFVPYDNKNDGGEFRDFTDYQIGHAQYEMGNDILTRANGDVVFSMMTPTARELTPWQDGDGEFKGDALVWQTFAGDKQGEALGNVLFGITPASGRLTTTWYADEDQLGDLQNDYSIYSDGDYKGRTYMHFTGDINYPFGYGLTYSEFEYSDMVLSANEVTGDDTLTVSVDVTNTSDLDGYDVVQVYVSSPNAAAQNRPDKKLAGFQKVWVEAGATETAEIDIDVADLAFWDEDNACWSCDLGEYDIYIGSDCETVIDSDTFEITADLTPVLSKASLVAEAFVSEEIGEEIATRASAALSNDVYFANVDEMPEGMTVVYKSNDESVATVDEDGVITTVGGGVCLISVEVTYEGVTEVGVTPVCVQLDKNPWQNVDQDDWFYEYAVKLWETDTVTIPYEVGGEYPNQNEDLVYDQEDSNFLLVEHLQDNGDGTYTYPGLDLEYGTADDDVIDEFDIRYQSILDSIASIDPEDQYILTNSAITNTGFGYTTKISIAAEANAPVLDNPYLALVGTTTDGKVAAWTIKLSSVAGEVTTLSVGAGMESVAVYLLDGTIDFADTAFGGAKGDVLNIEIQ